ncbi:hypothetical protein [Streptomyces sp. NPDC057686]
MGVAGVAAVLDGFVVGEDAPEVAAITKRKIRRLERLAGGV